jgi:hypothetical protein
MHKARGGTSMSEIDKRCAHLRRLQASLVQEINTLQESIREEEHEGVGNPLEMRRIIKSLQDVLNNVNIELEKCSTED